MGRGTDIAIESSKVVLLNNDLHYVSKAFRLSQQTVRTIKQNLFWAFIYNILAIPLAAGVFYTSLGWLLSPMVGAATMALSDVFVIGNSIALKFKSITK
jgi:Cu2+-exporting ATPase